MLAAKRVCMPESWESRIIEAGYRKLALELHPDHGGSTTEMASLNTAVQKLRAILLGDANLNNQPNSQTFNREGFPPQVMRVCPQCGRTDGTPIDLVFSMWPCGACGYFHPPAPGRRRRVARRAITLDELADFAARILVHGVFK